MIDPDGEHRFISDQTFNVEIAISNPSPNEWEVVDVVFEGLRRKDRRDRPAPWSRLTGTASVVRTSVPASTASTSPVRVDLNVATSRVFKGGIDVAVDPVGLELVVRRYNTTPTSKLPTHLTGGPLTIREAR
ncbi:MAG: hypothetical protein Q8Q52_01890 [Acidimicrobiia bacterium]|nr:hypothetical protein [Acidimicrobiia bacterium]